MLIVSYRNFAALERCLSSLRRHAAGRPVLVWDNHSDRTLSIRSLAQKHPEVVWIFSPENVGFAAAVNGLVDACSAEHMLLLNPDAELLASVERLLDGMRVGVAAVGAWTCDSEARRPWDSARRRVTPWTAALEAAGLGWMTAVPVIQSRYRRPPLDKNVGYIAGSCLLISRQAWNDVGAFDERFFLYSEEVDWQRRAQDKGWEVRQLPLVGSRHNAAGTVADDAALFSRSGVLLRSSRELYLRKHHGWSGVVRFRIYLRVLGATSTAAARLRRRIRWATLALSTRLKRLDAE